MYVKITNKSEPVDRRYFEKLGAGNKQDDERTIGQFGSGSCYAPLVALRTNRRYVVSGFDNTGLYQLEYKSEHVDGFDEIFYEYTVPVWRHRSELGEDSDYQWNDIEVIRKPSSFTLQAGNLGWNDPWQIFREAMSNALDEYYRQGSEYKIEIVGKIDPPVKGEISVYVSADRDMKKIVDNIDDYFLMNQTPIDDSFESVSVYKHRKTDKNTKIYMKGVLVFDGEKRDKGDMYKNSLYRYDLKHVELNEERSIKDTYDINNFVAYYVAKTGIMEVIKTIINNANEDFLETNLSPYVHSQYSVAVPDMWKLAWVEKYGPRAIAVDPYLPERTRRSLRLANWKLVEVYSSGMRKLLEMAGIPGPKDALGETIDYEIVHPSELPKDEMDNFFEAMTIVGAYEPNLEMMRVEIFAPDSNQRSVLGKAFIQEKRILIATTALKSLHTSIATLVHEVDHIVSESLDLTDDFRDAADNRLADLMIKYYKKSFKIKVDSDYIYLHNDMAKGVNYRLVNLGDVLFLEIATNVVYRLHHLGGTKDTFVLGKIEIVDGKFAIPRPELVTFLPDAIAEEVM